MRKSSLIIVLLVTILFISGCDTSKEKIVSNGETVNTSKMEHKHCTREATAKEGMEVSLSYDIYYTGDVLNILKSNEKVTSENSADLDTYENAYRKIQENYKGLEYFDAEVKREDNSVSNLVTINYDKIDIDRLLEIEGEEDNIIEDGVAKVDKWLSLSKKFGTKCSVVEK